MDSEQKILKETELGQRASQIAISALQSEMIALVALLETEKSVGYKADLVEQMKKNLINQQTIAERWYDLKYKLGEVL